MSKVFNVTADCKPDLHYMVNIEEKLRQIKVMVDRGDYFVINRARQYGKTTTLRALGKYLADEYVVISLDFQMLSASDFETEQVFVEAFSREVLSSVREMPGEIEARLTEFANGTARSPKLALLFLCLSEWCAKADKKVVLIIDEVDSAENNQVFLDFLSMLRGYYINRDRRPTFQSVILAGVYDIRNLKQKIRPDAEHKRNSPWNIAADFSVDMSFSVKETAGMLAEYEADYATGMDVLGIAQLLYDYTSGYPFLVSRLCKILDEEIAGSRDFPEKPDAWTKDGFLEALKILLEEKNALFESLINKLTDYSEIRGMIYSLLFKGQAIAYNALNSSVQMAEMFGFVKKEESRVVISNRIFETLLYNYFLSEELLNSDIYKAGLQDKNQFIHNGRLNMDLVLEKFVRHFDDLYGDREETFYEEDGRRYFLLYLRPIINGTGNYYIEAQTRNMEQTDVIVDYRGEQFVIELKIWRGDSYNTRGEEQLSGYLDYYHLKKGYMLSFNFNKKKEIGMKEVRLGDKLLVEAVV